MTVKMTPSDPEGDAAPVLAAPAPKALDTKVDRTTKRKKKDR